MKQQLTGWQRWLPWGIVGVMALWAISSLRPPADPSPFRIKEFSELPVLLNGRVQPMDSVARNSLLILRSKQSLALEDGKMMDATEWLLEMMTRPDKADEDAFIQLHPRVVDKSDVEKLVVCVLIAPVEGAVSANVVGA